MPVSQSCIIYGLRDPCTAEIRYVGSSRRGLVRPRVHAGLARRGEQSHKANWIRSLQTRGLSYEIVVLEIAPLDLDEAERKWIAIGRAALGARLTNMTSGGDGCPEVSEESARRRREKLLGHAVSEETRRRISEGRVGFRHTTENRKKISETQTGHKRHTEWSRAVIGTKRRLRCTVARLEALCR